MSSRRVALLVAASLSCTRPNPLFSLTDGDADDDGDLTTSTGAVDSDSGGPTTGAATAGGSGGSTSDPTDGGEDITGALTDTQGTTTTGSGVTDGGDTCDTGCDDPDQECLGGFACTGKLEWLRRSGDASIQRAADAAVLSDGSVVVVGNFAGEIGTAPNVITTTTEPAEADGFVLRLDPTGELVWVRAFAGAGLQWARAVVALPDDRIAVAGSFSGQLVLDPQQIDGFGVSQAFVAVLDPDGATTNLHILGGDDVTALDLALTPEGDGVLVGRFAGDLVIAGDKSTSDGVDLFAVGLDLASGPTWSWLPAAPDDQTAQAVAVAPSGVVFIAGELAGDLEIGGDTLTADGIDGFIAGLDDAGAPQWGARVSGPGDDRARAIAAAPDGTFVVTGVHGGGLDFGDGPVAEPGGYIAAFDGQGAPLWARAGFVLGAESPGVAIDGTGRVIVSLPLGDVAADLGGGPLGGVPGALVVKLTSAGNFVWGRHLAGPTTPSGPGIGVGPAGEIAVAGAFDPGLVHDPLMITSAGGLDIYVGRFLP